LLNQIQTHIVLKKDQVIRVSDYSKLPMGSLNRELNNELERIEKTNIQELEFKDISALYELIQNLHFITLEYVERYGCSTQALDEDCRTPLKSIRGIKKDALRRIERNKKFKCIRNESK